jgi:hypothetical protein
MLIVYNGFIGPVPTHVCPVTLLSTYATTEISLKRLYRGDIT